MGFPFSSIDFLVVGITIAYDFLTCLFIQNVRSQMSDFVGFI